MTALKRRIDALEARRPIGPGRWHRIIVDRQTEDEARADYEAEHGPISECDNIIYREIVDPTRVAA